MADKPNDETIEVPIGQRADGTVPPAEGEQPPAEEAATPPEGDTFPREYVERLRRENAGYREKAQRVEARERELFEARVAATGRLQDPTDLPFDPALVDDAEALAAAVDDLLARKPHLATRRVVGDIGQGSAGGSPEGFSLAGTLRGLT